MIHNNRAELVELGLSPTEAQVYLALIQGAPLGASDVATATGLSRTAVYQILCALTDKGLVESGAGYGSKFAVVSPERALPALIAHEEEALAQRKKIAESLSQRLAVLADRIEAAPEEVIEIIKSPRAVAERFVRLQLEAENYIEAFTKPPIFNRSGNPALEKALRRGVRARSLYEKKSLKDPEIGPFLAKWVAAGVQARVFDGELPHKLAIFDRQIVLMPLIRPGEQPKTLLIRYPQLAESLTLTFEHLWEQSEPLIARADAQTSSTAKPVIRRKQRVSSNGRLSPLGKK
jgi:sugar-specific transcriptional regulator TrmB